VIASTPACAAVHGLSGGTIGKCQLIRLVVESLKSLQRTCSEEVEVPRVLEVSVHEKSAHVNVTLEVPPSMLVRTAATGTKPSSHSTKPAPASMSTNDLNNVSIVDPISEFMSRLDSITNQLSNTTSPSCPVEELDNSHQRRFLNVRSVPVHESTLQPEVHQLYCRYQSAIHGDVDPFFGCDAAGSNNSNAREYCSYRRKHNPPGFLDVDTVYSNLDEGRRANIKLSYLAFYRFLGETPVAAHCIRNDSSHPFHPDYDVPYGTYHQQYRLSTSRDGFDGPLIAVGVTDILPHCLSSVYSFYDPILSSKLELGKYTALREIEWVRRASRLRPDLHYYYLGERWASRT